MAPPVEALTSRPTSAARIASISVNVPATLTSKLWRGFSMEGITRVSAARCTTASTPSSAGASTAASRMSPAMNVQSRSPRNSRRPSTSLSSTRTENPPRRLSSATRFVPTNPHPPVTSTFKAGPLSWWDGRDDGTAGHRHRRPPEPQAGVGDDEVDRPLAAVLELRRYRQREPVLARPLAHAGQIEAELVGVDAPPERAVDVERDVERDLGRVAAPHPAANRRLVVVLAGSL